jgi:hypothetical protein
MTIEDLKDLQEDFNIKMDNNNMILYHATTKENAEQIIKTQSMYGKEDGLFFSTKPNGQIKGYGNSIIEVKIPYNKLLIDDQFDDELHFRMPCRINTFYHITAKMY